MKGHWEVRERGGERGEGERWGGERGGELSIHLYQVFEADLMNWREEAPPLLIYTDLRGRRGWVFPLMQPGNTLKEAPLLHNLAWDILVRPQHDSPFLWCIQWFPISLLHTVIPLFFAAPRKPWGKAHTLHGAPEMPGGAPGLSGRGEGGQHLAWACLEMPGGAPGLSGRPTKAHWGPPMERGENQVLQILYKRAGSTATSQFNLIFHGLIIPVQQRECWHLTVSPK